MEQAPPGAIDHHGIILPPLPGLAMSAYTASHGWEAVKNRLGPLWRRSMSAEDHDSKGAAVIDRRYSPIFSQLLSPWATFLRRCRGLGGFSKPQVNVYRALPRALLVRPLGLRCCHRLRLRTATEKHRSQRKGRRSPDTAIECGTVAMMAAEKTRTVYNVVGVVTKPAVRATL